MSSPVPVVFAGGSSGLWRVERIVAVAGAGLPSAERLAVHEGATDAPSDSTSWLLRGVTGHHRYVESKERPGLAGPPPLGRAEARSAALIPIRKSAAWWELAQDERRAILEEQSHHIAVGLQYVPAIARRLYHSRELGEPFDFLTWFEFAPSDGGAFDALLAKLRATQEWKYVEREVEVRLTR